MNTYIGIDVAKETLAVCLLQEKGNQQAEVTNTPEGYKKLHRWLKKHQAKSGHVCLEATGVYGIDVAQFLHDMGYQVSVVNPLRVKGFAQGQMQRNKNDQVDAQVIADFCRALQPELWTPPDPAWYELRALVRHIDDLQHTRTQQRNRLEACRSPVIGEQITQHIAFIDNQIAEAKSRINDHLDNHPDLRRQAELLKSIPGIADITAIRILAEIRSIAAFDNVRQLVAWAGLDPTQFCSGRTVKRPGTISRKGHSSLRTALFFPALVAKRCNPTLKTFAERLEANGKHPRKVQVAVMRKLLHLAFGVLKSGKPFDPNFSPQHFAT